ncbi:MAG: metallophosphoesterase family protein [Promethearchaeota archaeon]
MTKDIQRILIIADIHGNFEALKTILEEIDHDGIIFLGDMVSFGPDPHLCIDLLRQENCFLTLMGNHDYAILDKDRDCKTKWPYKPLGITTREHARRILSEDQMAWLGNLKQSSSFSLGEYTVYAAHGSPKDPLFGELFATSSDSQLMTETEGIKEQYVLCAHTHAPFIRVLPTGVTIINPGSVGQSADGNNRASCAVIDLFRSYNQIHRIKYDIGKTVQRIKEENLPLELVTMLERGGY